MFGVFKDIAEAKDVHYKLWDWLYQNPTKSKSEWPEWEMNDGTIPVCSFWCAACEVAGSDFCEDKCKACPIQWTSKNGFTMKTCNQHEEVYEDGSTVRIQVTGLFVLWHRSNDLELRCNYAKMIRDLEWKGSW